MNNHNVVAFLLKPLTPNPSPRKFGESLILLAQRNGPNLRGEGSPGVGLGVYAKRCKRLTVHSIAKANTTKPISHIISFRLKKRSNAPDSSDS